MKQLVYRRKLVDELTQSVRSVSSHSGRRCPSSLERLQPNPHFLRRGDKRVDCMICSEQTQGKRHFTHFHCETCTDNPLLCPTDCFKTYHTKQNYKSTSL